MYGGFSTIPPYIFPGLRSPACKAAITSYMLLVTCYMLLVAYSLSAGFFCWRSFDFPCTCAHPYSGAASSMCLYSINNLLFFMIPNKKSTSDGKSEADFWGRHTALRGNGGTGDPSPTAGNGGRPMTAPTAGDCGVSCGRPMTAPTAEDCGAFCGRPVTAPTA
jgi:hypothetical protein